jgi:hypothetical protein
MTHCAVELWLAEVEHRDGFCLFEVPCDLAAFEKFPDRSGVGSVVRRVLNAVVGARETVDGPP